MGHKKHSPPGLTRILGGDHPAGINTNRVFEMTSQQQYTLLLTKPRCLRVCIVFVRAT